MEVPVVFHREDCITLMLRPHLACNRLHHHQPLLHILEYSSIQDCDHRETSFLTTPLTMGGNVPQTWNIGSPGQGSVAGTPAPWQVLDQMGNASSANLHSPQWPLLHPSAFPQTAHFMNYTHKQGGGFSHSNTRGKHSDNTSYLCIIPLGFCIVSTYIFIHADRRIWAGLIRMGDRSNTRTTGTPPYTAPQGPSTGIGTPNRNP